MAVGSPIGEAFIRVRADTTAFKADVQAGAALAGTGAGGVIAPPRLGTAALNAEASAAGLSASRNLEGGLLAGSGRVEKALAAPFIAGAKQMLAPLAAVAIAAGAIHLGKSVVQETVAAQQSAETVKLTFLGAADAVTKFDDAGAALRGIAPDLAEKFSSVFGAFMINAGLSTTEAAKLSNQLVQTAADLAVLKNVDASVPLIALQGALRGNFRALGQFGVSMTQGTVQARAFKLGLIDTANGTLDASSKLLATMSLLKDKTAFAAGAAAGDTAVAAMKKAGAVFKLTEEELGNKLLPVITAVAKFFADALPGALTHTQQAFHVLGAVLTPVTELFKLIVRIPGIGQLTLLAGAATLAAKAFGILKTVTLGKIVTDVAALAGAETALTASSAAATAGTTALAVGTGRLSAAQMIAADGEAVLAAGLTTVTAVEGDAIVRTGGLAAVYGRLAIAARAAGTSMAMAGTAAAEGGLAGAAAGIAGGAASMGASLAALSFGLGTLTIVGVAAVAAEKLYLGQITDDTTKALDQTASREEAILQEHLRKNQKMIEDAQATIAATTAEDAKAISDAGIADPNSASAQAIIIHNQVDRIKFGSLATKQAQIDAGKADAKARQDAFDATAAAAFAKSMVGALKEAGTSANDAAISVGQSLGDAISAGIDAASVAKVHQIQSGIGPLGAATREANKLQSALDARSAAAQEKQLRDNVTQAARSSQADQLQAAIDARNVAAQRANLQANVTAAKTPAALATAQQALADFNTTQQIQSLRAAKNTADAQGALQDFLDQQKIAKLRAVADKAAKVEEDSAAKKRAAATAELKKDTAGLEEGRITVRKYFADLLGLTAALGPAGAALRGQVGSAGGPGGTPTADRAFLAAIERLAEALGAPNTNVIQAVNIFDARNPVATGKEVLKAVAVKAKKR